MSLNISFAIFLLGLVLSQAIPTTKVEKSLTKSNLKPEETGEEVERSKKSVLCLDSGSMVPQVQSYNIQAAPQVQTLSIQPAGQSVQTLNIQAMPQPVQTLSIQSVPQPIQTLSLIQPPVPAAVISQQNQASMKLIQHSPNSCPPSQTNVNIIQPLKEEKIVKVKPAPVVETVIQPEKIVKPEPKPEKLVVTKVEKQIMVPAVPLYEEQLVMVPPKPVMMVAEAEPMTSCVKVPHCHSCQQALMQCTCKSQGMPAMGSAVMVEPAMRLVGVRERAVGRHSLTPMHRSLIHHL